MTFPTNENASHYLPMPAPGKANFPMPAMGFGYDAAARAASRG
jgi:hypothetical protein